MSKNNVSFKESVNINGAFKALGDVLKTRKVIRKEQALSAGIVDPNRTVNRLRADGWEIETTTHRTLRFLKGETYYSLIS